MSIARKSMWPLVAIGLITIGGGGAAWWLAGRAPRIDANDPAQVALGEAVYRAHCANCHGANLEGQPDWRNRLPTGRLPAPPHDETGHTWHHSDEVLVRMVAEGPAFYGALGVETDMPGFENTLSDRDIAAVLAYIKSRWPPKIQARQAGLGR